MNEELKKKEFKIGEMLGHYKAILLIFKAEESFKEFMKTCGNEDLEEITKMFSND